MGQIKDAVRSGEAALVHEHRRYITNAAGRYVRHHEGMAAAALKIHGGIITPVWELAKPSHPVPENGHAGIKLHTEIPQQIAAGFDREKGRYSVHYQIGDTPHTFSVGTFAGDVTVYTPTTRITSYVDVTSHKTHSPTLDIKYVTPETGTATRIVTFQSNYHSSELHPDILPLQVAREEGQFGLHGGYTNIDGDGMVQMAEGSPLFAFHRDSARRLTPIRLVLKDGFATSGFSVSATDAAVSVINPDGTTITLPRQENIRTRLRPFLQPFPTKPGLKAA